MARLSPGFRFHPTDVELIMYHLKRKVMGKPMPFKAIEELDLYKFAPWDLKEKSWLQSRDLEWYFFCPRGRKYRNGQRVNRANEIGFWKSTGNDRPVKYNSQTVGKRKTLVFHVGRAPGLKTEWVMHEYRLEDKDLVDAGILQDAYVLCKIFEKSGPGPKNGEQRGAPFKEEDWDGDVLNGFSSADPGSSSLVPVDNQTVYEEISELVLGNTCLSSLESPCQTVSSNAVEEQPSLPKDDELEALLASVDFEECPFLRNGDDNNEMKDSSHAGSTVAAPHRLDGNDIYDDLDDPSTREEQNDGMELDELKVPLQSPMEANSSERVPYKDQYDRNNCDNLGKDNGFGGNAICGYDAAIDNLAAPSGGKAEESGNKDVPLALERGAQHRASHSRLQSLLGSIPARPALAVEYPSTNQEKIAKGNSLLSSYGRSSIHVKADVTVQCGCTKDTLSGKLLVFPRVCYVCNLPRRKFGGTATCSSGFTFVFFLGVVAVLMWVSLFAIAAKFCRHAWKRSLS